MQWMQQTVLSVQYSAGAAEPVFSWSVPDSLIHFLQEVSLSRGRVIEGNPSLDHFFSMKEGSGVTFDGYFRSYFCLVHLFYVGHFCPGPLLHT